MITESHHHAGGVDALDAATDCTEMFSVARVLHAIMVGADNRPDSHVGFGGLLVQINQERAIIDIEADEITTNRLLLGVEGHNDNLIFTTLVIETQVISGSAYRVEGRFASGASDPLRKENLLPRLNRETQRYEFGMSEDILQQWVDIGVLRPRLVDRVLTCPMCSSVVGFRHGCRDCGSGRTLTTRMMHHFACAHVGPVEDFETGDDLVCPKCLTAGLIVGADFEFFDGVSSCLDCEWTDSELAVVGSCLSCSLRMPIQLTQKQDLIAYDVDRLDPLAIIDES